MRTLILFCLLSLPTSMVMAQFDESPVVAAQPFVPYSLTDYFRSHARMAVEEMHFSGIPASVTLAQAILESGMGNSRLAREGNNHFGIKCKSIWTGDTLLVKDDDLDASGMLIESCFRRYASTEVSFRDHSVFLMESPRYQSLFEYPSHDYVSWANGLQQCGYATNPEYATKLIRLIEKHQLQAFDFVPFDAADDCLSYYDTHCFIVQHQAATHQPASNTPPSAIRLPENYKGGWFKENRKMRLIYDRMSIPSDTPVQQSVLAAHQDDTYLNFEVGTR